jgi:amino acid transporter
VYPDALAAPGSGDAAAGRATCEFSAMTPSDPSTRERRADSALAVSIMFFGVTLLCLLLGWAEGVRRGTRYLHIPETGGWLVAAAVLGAIGAVFLVWSRGAKRS